MAVKSRSQSFKDMMSVFGWIFLIQLILSVLFGLWKSKYYLMVMIVFNIFLMLIMYTSKTERKQSFFEYTGFGTSIHDEMLGKKYEYENLLKPDKFESR
jgi:ABC-type transport system involved in cytochrome bd biosynthesis fused ATPase/permease subunit